MLANENDGECSSLRRIELAINDEIGRLSARKKEMLLGQQSLVQAISDIERELTRIGDDFGLSASDLLGMFTGNRLRQAIALAQTANAASTISQVEKLLQKKKELEVQLSDLPGLIVAISYDIIQKNKERDANIGEQFRLGCPSRSY